MAKFPDMRWPNVLHSAEGQEIAEAAVVIPLLFVFVIAILWFGQAFSIYGTVTQAARAGARAAVAPACTTCAPLTTAQSVTIAVSAVTNVLSASNLNPSQIKAPSPIPTFCPCGSTSSACTPVNTCTAGTSASNVCVEPNVQLSYSTVSGNAAGAGTCGTAVSFRYNYPFHFTLPCWPAPCHSFDLNTIYIPAEAEMRAETQ
jgi:hypothetical protein